MDQGGEVLSVEGLSVAFPGRRVLENVDFRLEAGELCGLIGANGSGKTTLLRTILGLHRPSGGRVRVAGSVGYVPQKLLIDPFLPMRGYDMVALGLDGNRFGFPLPSRARSRAVEDMLEAVNATQFAHQRLGQLSGGQQQRISIAHALVRRPRMLLLDEPLANLDLRSVNEIVALLRRLATEQRITVLLSAHDMNPLLPVMDRIVYLANGRAVSGRADDVVRGEVLSDLYGVHVDVIRVHGRILVIAAGNETAPAIDDAHVEAVP